MAAALRMCGIVKIFTNRGAGAECRAEASSVPRMPPIRSWLSSWLRDTQPVRQSVPADCTGKTEYKWEADVEKIYIPTI